MGGKQFWRIGIRAGWRLLEHNDWKMTPKYDMLIKQSIKLGGEVHTAIQCGSSREW
eukprot:TRINITY_DN3013_c0_g1_i4.p4 TRINITY_DN3013_c0_g1~~TRINITY_DN3013_c0_g1_i4.p4  ORF type:complete len:56 (+),score=5.92 TRINITY_DN3013_c0_g1_i4:48-215(+)